MAAIVVDRAAAHAQLGEHSRVVADCTEAIGCENIREP